MNEPCMCGATDCPRCYPASWNRPEPTERHMELALESVVECILDHGQYPEKGKLQFELYDFLANRDVSCIEMYVLAIGVHCRTFDEHVEREQKLVKSMLMKELKDSDIVAELSEEYAAVEHDET